MRILLMATLLTLALVAAPALVPAAEELAPAGSAEAAKCIYGYTPDCIIYNRCDPTYCDPIWP